MPVPEQVQELERRFATLVEQALAAQREAIVARLRQREAELPGIVASSLVGVSLPTIDLSGWAPAAPREEAAEANAGFATLRDALARVDAARTQADLLATVLDVATSFADRAVLLLVHADGLAGWACTGFGGGVQAVEAVTVAPIGTWAEVAAGRGVVALDAGDSARLIEPLAGTPASVAAAVPLVLRDHLAAVLYADRTSESRSLDVAALQVLMYASTQALETLPLRQVLAPCLAEAGERLEQPALAPWDAAAMAATQSVASEPAPEVSLEPEPAAAAPPSPEPWSAWQPAAAAASEPIASEIAEIAEVAAEPEVAASLEAPWGAPEPEPVPQEPAPPTAWSTETAAWEEATGVGAIPATSAAAEPAWTEPIGDLEPPAEAEAPAEGPAAVDTYALAAEPAYEIAPEAETTWEAPAAELAPVTAVEPNADFAADDGWGAVGTAAELPPVEVAYEAAPAELPEAELAEAELSELEAAPLLAEEPLAATSGYAYAEVEPEPVAPPVVAWELPVAEPTPAFAPAAEEPAEAPTQMLPAVGYADEGPATDADATVLITQPSLPEVAPAAAAADSPNATMMWSIPVAPAAPAVEPMAPPVMAPPTPAPPPVVAAPLPAPVPDVTPAVATTEVKPPAAKSGDTVEVRPPEDLQGPGWAFATTRIQTIGRDPAHEEARRLARLLVSEIKLYNEELVDEGRRMRNIYGLLKEDIDRSRQMFNERVDAKVRSEADYFHQELVRILAAGDAVALGV